MKLQNINILIATHAPDTKGRDVETWAVNCIIYDSFQALKYSDGFKVYGITDKTSNVVFCRDAGLIARYLLPDTDPNQFNATYRIGYNSKQYIIDSIVAYPKHLEIYLEKVV
jgi:hypothetical protein